MSRARRADVLVGIFLVVALALTFAVVRGIKTHGWVGGERYPLRIVFAELSESLPNGSPVRLAGVTVGRVDKVWLSSPEEIGGVPESYGAADQVVVVECRVAKGTVVREDYRVTVSSGFPLGETFVDIMPTRSRTRALSAGEVLIGEVAPSVTDIAPLVAQSLDQVNRASENVAKAALLIGHTAEDVGSAAGYVGSAAKDVTTGVGALTGLIASARGDIHATFLTLNETAKSVASITQSLEPLVTDKQFTENLRLGVTTLADTGEHMVRVAQSLDALIGGEENQQRMQRTLDAMEQTMTTLEQVAANVARVANNPENAANLESMLEDSASAAENMSKLTADMREIVGREGLKEDVAQITQSLSSASASIDKLLSDPKLNEDIRASASNIAEATGSLNEMMDDELKGNVRSTVSDLSAAAAEIRRLLTETNATRDFEAAMSGLRETSATLAEFARGLRGTAEGAGSRPAGDAPPSAEGSSRAPANGRLGQTMDAARREIEFLDRNFDRSALEANEDVLYSPTDGRFSTNFTAEVRRRGRLGASFGLFDIGRTNRVKFQVNRPWGDVVGRAGVYDSTAGIGADWWASDRTVLSADLYNANRPDVDLQLTHRIGEHIRINARVENLLRDRDAMFGLGWHF